MQILFVLIFVMFSVSAQAQTQSLTIDQVIQIGQGLSQLDCAQKVIKDGTKESIVCEPYKWSPGMVWQIAMAQKKARDVIVEFNRVREAEIAKLVRKPDGTPTDDSQAQFTVKIRAILDSDSKITFDKFKREPFEAMNLSPGTISLLLPIIE